MCNFHRRECATSTAVYTETPANNGSHPCPSVQFFPVKVCNSIPVLTSKPRVAQHHNWSSRSAGHECARGATANIATACYSAGLRTRTTELAPDGCPCPEQAGSGCARARMAESESGSRRSRPSTDHEPSTTIRLAGFRFCDIASAPSARKRLLGIWYGGDNGVCIPLGYSHP